MKRSVFFWAVVSAALVFVVWAVLFLLVVGVAVFWQRWPTHRTPTFSERLRSFVIHQEAWRNLARLLESSTNSLWKLAPYCQPPKPNLGFACALGTPRMEVAAVHLGGGGKFFNDVLLYWPAWGRPYDGVVLPVGRARSKLLVVHICLMPGVHSALVGFALGGAIGVLGPGFFRSILPAERNSSESEEAGRG